MKTTLRHRLAARKRQIENRLDKTKLGDWSKPMFSASNIHYEIAERVHGIAYGGIGAFHLLARRIGLIDAIDKSSIFSRFICPITNPIMCSTLPTTPCATAIVCKTSNCAATMSTSSTPWRPAHPRSDHGRRFLPPLQALPCQPLARHL